MKETLVGALFTVSPQHVARTAPLYAAVGLVHILLRGPLFEITNDPAGARGRRIFAWDFLFYATFGLVVTSSVQMTGVLLVALAGLLVLFGTGLSIARRSAAGLPAKPEVAA